jgi:hypothetical protein
MDKAAGAERWKRLRELSAAFLMGFAALATSWIGYQTSRWSGLQSSSSTESSVLRMKSNRANGEAVAAQIVDLSLFTNWVDAYATGNRSLDSFYRERFRPEFKPAFEAWVASHPRRNPDAAPSPFVLPDYRVAKKEEAKGLEDSAETVAAQSHRQSAVKDRYVATVVLLATSLFFSGMSRQFARPGVQAAMLILAALLCLAGLYGILALPVLL